ncbi:WbqC family protein [Streptomyces decoyicus]
MPPTNPSSRTASTAASSRSELPPPGGLCAIHQPNLFPRLSMLAKLFAADCWIVLDDVRFTRRDYQHRTRRMLQQHYGTSPHGSLPRCPTPKRAGPRGRARRPPGGPR